MRSIMTVQLGDTFRPAANSSFHLTGRNFRNTKFNSLHLRCVWDTVSQLFISNFFRRSDSMLKQRMSMLFWTTKHTHSYGPWDSSEDCLVRFLTTTDLFNKPSRAAQIFWPTVYSWPFLVVFGFNCKGKVMAGRYRILDFAKSSHRKKIATRA